MTSSIADCTQLNNGVEMPWLGFGVFQMDNHQEVKQAIKDALETGYRSIDTASIYKNEQGVGAALKENDVPRKDIFLTTKVWNEDMRKNRVQEAFAESLERLQTDYVDLYLAHWPVAGCYVETWKQMEKIYESGRAKAIGVSNFMVHHLEDLLDSSNVVPTVNQVEFHPYLVQPELLDFCKNNNIQVEAWSPLMQGHVVNDATIKNLADKYGKTPAQIVIRWDIQHKVVTIPKSSKSNRIIENTQVFDFELSKEDMETLDALDTGKRFGPDPFNFDF